MAAIGSNPFEFTDTNGKQVSIPLGALKFTSGALDVDGTVWPPFSTYLPPIPAQIKALLSDLVTAQVLTKPIAVAPKPAMVINAADAGIAGNNVKVAIVTTTSADLDPTKAKFDITVTETDVYTGLSMTTIEAILGNETTAGSQPGLAHIVAGSVDATILPKTPQSSPFPVAAAAVKAKLDIVDSSATPKKVFTLEAKKAGPGSQSTTASITNVNSGAKTFDLTLTWTKKMVASTLPTLQADIAAALLDYEVAITAPSSGAISVPATTTSPVSLSGGSASASAAAVIFAA